VKPETKYARSGDVHIAYQTFGQGPLDLVAAPGFVSHVELGWEDPLMVRYYEQLASFARVLMFDKRGTGMSDRVAGMPTLEERMDDLRAVMDAESVESAALFGVSEGGSMSMLFSATYPERTRALVLFGAMARFVRDNDYPWGLPPEQIDRIVARYEEGWGQGFLLPMMAPSLVEDPYQMELQGRYERMAASPGSAIALLRMNAEIDVRDILSAIRVPTLVLHREGDKLVRVGNGRYIAEHIPGAEYVELPGTDHAPWVGETEATLGRIQEFLTGTRAAPVADRVLATVLFTDIVGSTARAADLGDRAWRDVLGRFYALVRRELSRFRGIEVDTAGDGFLASFDGPARAIQCACAIRDGVGDLGINLRAGVHTGECERMADGLSGIAVHIGARVADVAEPGEVVVSSTVKDLVAGSGIEFRDRGEHTLKGVPDSWRLYGVGV
jgi:pimeloyl-ACP methyl ester carboxylesterase